MAQQGVNVILDKENHSVFIPYDIGLTKGTKLIRDGLGSSISASLIQQMGGNSRPPDAKLTVVVLKGRRVVKKTYVMSKIPKNIVGSPGALFSTTDGGIVEDGSPASIDDADGDSKQGEEGAPAFSI